MDFKAALSNISGSQNGAEWRVCFNNYTLPTWLMCDVKRGRRKIRVCEQFYVQETVCTFLSSSESLRSVWKKISYQRVYRHQRSAASQLASRRYSGPHVYTSLPDSVDRTITFPIKSGLNAALITINKILCSVSFEKVKLPSRITRCIFPQSCGKNNPLWVNVSIIAGLICFRHNFRFPISLFLPSWI